jgi:uncharacterized membrane protein YkvA (DUF1232 family)
MTLFSKISSWAKVLKLDVLALWFALKQPTMPFWAKVVCFVAVAYALSPIDLIPDFIPVLGYLDDLIIVPALVWLALKLIPAEVMNQSREQAVEWINSNQSKPKSYVGLTIVVVIWLICLAFVAEQAVVFLRH